VTYQARTDLRTILLLGAGFIFPLLGLFGGDGEWAWTVPAGALAVFFGAYFPQSYETTGDRLVIRAGFRRIGVPYSDIQEVVPSAESNKASLALAKDRMMIRYRGKSSSRPTNRMRSCWISRCARRTLRESDPN